MQYAVCNKLIERTVYLCKCYVWEDLYVVNNAVCRSCYKQLYIYQLREGELSQVHISAVAPLLT